MSGITTQPKPSDDEVKAFGLDMGKIKQIMNELKPFYLTEGELREVMNLLNKEFEEGLKEKSIVTASKAPKPYTYPAPFGTIKMLIAYVQDVPKGDEVGDYMGLDLGGTNFRVIKVNLSGKEAKIDYKKYRIPEELKTGEGADLFNFIAKGLIEFCEENNLYGRRLPLGFTFSYPCEQYGLATGYLIRWTKGFQCANTVGRDPVKLLKVCRLNH